MSRRRDEGDDLSGADVHGTTLIMKAKNVWPLLVAPWRDLKTPLVWCFGPWQGAIRSKVGGLSYLCAVSLWQVVSLGSLPLQSVLCISDLMFVYPPLCLLISHTSLS